MTQLDRDICYRALKTRDARFDGRFYTCVLSTGIFCRPICPARTPKPEHCLFMPSAAAAVAAGFRPCLRCRPEVAPGIAGWRGTANTVSRALRLISDGGLDEDGVETLAERLGVGGRHLRRLFDRHVGAAPVAVAQTHRILFAKTLIAETDLPMTEVALAAGFGSVRRFNAVMRATFGRPPGDLRRTARSGGSGGGSGNANAGDGAGVTLRLPYTPPYDWDTMIGFLAARAIPGMESVEHGRYRRTIAIEDTQGWDVRGSIEIAPEPDAAYLRATIRVSNVRALAAIVGRARRLFDLDADIAAIEDHLSGDPHLGPLVAARPGLRVPGAWDGFEMAVRAIIGQQVSVAAATTMIGRLAAAHGVRVADAGPGLGLTFPGPAALADADLTAIGLTRNRARAISALAAASVADPNVLRPRATLEETVEALCRLPGIGPWTANYIAMRALGEPDAFLATDVGVLRAMATPEGRPTPARMLTIAEAWRPWRAYAVLHLWMSETG